MVCLTTNGTFSVEKNAPVIPHNPTATQFVEWMKIFSVDCKRSKVHLHSIS